MTPLTEVHIVKVAVEVSPVPTFQSRTQTKVTQFDMTLTWGEEGMEKKVQQNLGYLNVTFICKYIRRYMYLHTYMNNRTIVHIRKN